MKNSQSRERTFWLFDGRTIRERYQLNDYWLRPRDVEMMLDCSNAHVYKLMSLRKRHDMRAGSQFPNMRTGVFSHGAAVPLADVIAYKLRIMLRRGWPDGDGKPHVGRMPVPLSDADAIADALYWYDMPWINTTDVGKWFGVTDKRIGQLIDYDFSRGRPRTVEHFPHAYKIRPYMRQSLTRIPILDAYNFLKRHGREIPSATWRSVTAQALRVKPLARDHEIVIDAMTASLKFKGGERIR